MTTLAALLGALPLMLGTGVGSELRHPLGVTMVGGLIVSQLLTLFTTPVIYLGFAGLAQKWRERRTRAGRMTVARPSGPRALWERARVRASGARSTALLYQAAPHPHPRPLGKGRASQSMSAAFSISSPFIHRPGRHHAADHRPGDGGHRSSYFLLPVAPLPQVDYPTISVSASACPGASPDTIAATVATPLERALGAIAGVNEITSSLHRWAAPRITLQFDLEPRRWTVPRATCRRPSTPRARLLPTGMPSNPTYRKVNPADSPIMILALTSGSLTRGQMYDAASTVMAQKLWRRWRAWARPQHQRWRTACGARAARPRLRLASQRCLRWTQVRVRHHQHQCQPPPGLRWKTASDHYWQVDRQRPGPRGGGLRPPGAALDRDGNAIRLAGRGPGDRLGAGRAQLRRGQRQAGHPAASCTSNRAPTSLKLSGAVCARCLPALKRASIPAAIDIERRLRPHAHACAPRSRRWSGPW